MEKTRAVIFDMDDTLLLTREVKWNHHRHVARTSYGIELDDETLRTHWGKPFDEMIGHYYRHSATPDEMRAANASSAAQFPKQPVPGAVELVTRLLDEGAQVGVVTSTRTQMALADLTRCGFPVERLFLVQGADQSPVHKPDPAVFDNARALLADLGVADVTYVGDALMDEQAATAAGLAFVAITTGLFGAEEFPSGTRTVATIDELDAELG